MPISAQASDLEIILHDKQPKIAVRSGIIHGQEIRIEEVKGYIDKKFMLRNAYDGTDKELRINHLTFKTPEYDCGSDLTLCDISKAESLSFINELEIYRSEIFFPLDMSQRLLKYFQEGQHGDCSVFAHYMNHMPYEPNQDEPNKWNLNLDAWSIKPIYPLAAGDTILFYSNPGCTDPSVEDVTHFAINLDKDLFISRMGLDQPLTITDLEQLKKGYGPCVNRIIPKKIK